MTRLPDDRREVYPSKPRTGRRRAPSFGPRLNVSVAISIGLPLMVVGLVLLLASVTTDRALFLILGGPTLAVGGLLFASGKRL
jgi:hypothetical protein